MKEAPGVRDSDTLLSVSDLMYTHHYLWVLNDEGTVAAS